MASGRFGMKLEVLNQGKDNNGDQLLSGKITSQSFVNTLFGICKVAADEDT